MIMFASVWLIASRGKRNAENGLTGVMDNGGFLDGEVGGM